MIIAKFDVITAMLLGGIVLYTLHNTRTYYYYTVLVLLKLFVYVVLAWVDLGPAGRGQDN